MSTPLQLSDARPDGCSLGQSAADLVALHGATPTSQDATQDAVLSTVITTAATSTNPFGFGSAAQADAITDIIEDLRSTLDAVVTACIHKGILASA